MKNKIGQKHPKTKAPSLRNSSTKTQHFNRTIMANLLCQLPWKNLLYGCQTLGHLLPRFILELSPWFSPPFAWHIPIHRCADTNGVLNYLKHLPTIYQLTLEIQIRYQTKKQISIDRMIFSQMLHITPALTSTDRIISSPWEAAPSPHRHRHHRLAIQGLHGRWKIWGVNTHRRGEPKKYICVYIYIWGCPKMVVPNNYWFSY